VHADVRILEALDAPATAMAVRKESEGIAGQLLEPRIVRAS
jgi:hypothetical protein